MGFTNGGYNMIGSDAVMGSCSPTFAGEITPYHLTAQDVSGLEENSLMPLTNFSCTEVDGMLSFATICSCV